MPAVSYQVSYKGHNLNAPTQVHSKNLTKDKARDIASALMRAGHKGVLWEEQQRADVSGTASNTTRSALNSARSAKANEARGADCRVYRIGKNGQPGATPSASGKFMTEAEAKEKIKYLESVNPGTRFVVKKDSSKADAGFDLADQERHANKAQKDPSMPTPRLDAAASALDGLRERMDAVETREAAKRVADRAARPDSDSWRHGEGKEHQTTDKERAAARKAKGATKADASLEKAAKGLDERWYVTKNGFIDLVNNPKQKSYASKAEAEKALGATGPSQRWTSTNAKADAGFTTWTNAGEEAAKRFLAGNKNFSFSRYFDFLEEKGTTTANRKEAAQGYHAYMAKNKTKADATTSNDNFTDKFYVKALYKQPNGKVFERTSGPKFTKEEQTAELNKTLSDKRFYEVATYNIRAKDNLTGIRQNYKVHRAGRADAAVTYTIEIKRNDGRWGVMSTHASLSEAKAAEARAERMYGEVRVKAKREGAKKDAKQFATKSAGPARKDAGGPKTMNGEEVKVGDFVGFKDGVEQSGKVTSIMGDTLIIAVWDSQRGKSVEVRKSASRTWIE